MAQKKQKRRKIRSSGGVIAILLTLLGLILVTALLVHAFTGRGRRSPEPESAVAATATPAPTLPPSELVVGYFGSQDGYITYASDTIVARHGVDVSAFQGVIDWEEAARSGIDFAILRAGYRGYGDGETAQDDLFSYNLETALGCGLDVGVYFFSQAVTEEEARQEAREVLEMVEGYALAYPIYFDWEPIEAGARTDTISSSELTRCARAFCETVEAAGYRAGVYFNLSMAAHYYHLYDLKDYSFWLAEYQDIPTFPYQFDLWQYSNQGTVPGISATVDLDLSFEPAP